MMSILFVLFFLLSSRSVIYGFSISSMKQMPLHRNTELQFYFSLKSLVKNFIFCKLLWYTWHILQK